MLFSRIFGAGLLTAVLAGSVSAATVTEVDTVNTSGFIPGSTAVGATLDDRQSQSLAIAQFDQTLGTLTGVDVTVTGQLSVQGGFFNVTPTFGYLASNSVQLFGSGLSVTANVTSAGSCTVLPSGDCDDTVISFNVAQAQNVSGTVSGTLANWIGTGDIILGTFSNTSVNWGGTSAVTSIGVTGFGNLTVTTTYTYTPNQPVVPAVPLPAGLPLLVGGLGALAWAARRRSHA